MMLFYQIVFWLSIMLLGFTTVGYPILIIFLSRKKKLETNIYESTEELPFLSVLIAAFNEEKIIAKKIATTLNTTYPKDKFEIIIGSDCSSDRTADIVSQLGRDNSNIKLVDFNKRTGKSGVMNRLVEEAKGDFLVLSDVKAFFLKDTLYLLMRHFKDERIGIVGANICDAELKKKQSKEKAYMKREISMKYAEGLIWKKVAGVFGACFAIRKSSFPKIPTNFLVDDFFITLEVMFKNMFVIQELEAQCVETVTTKITEEFRRKVRIATGNFQNLFYFGRRLFAFSSLSFVVVAHKILRWLGPFLLLMMMWSLLNLHTIEIYRYFLLSYLCTFVLVFIDVISMKINKHFLGLRVLTHFYLMNFAMLLGFINYIKGVKTGAWEPTKR